MLMKFEELAGNLPTVKQLKSVGKKQREPVFDPGPTSEDGARALRFLSSLFSGDSLQHAAIISFRSTEEEGVLWRPHRGEEDQ